MRRQQLVPKTARAVFAAVPVLALALIVYVLVVGGERFETRLIVVEPGDSLSEIGKRFGVTAEAIAALNGIEDPSRIYPNQVLLVPTAPDARVPKTLAERAAALTRVPSGVRRRPWRWIVVHHSAGASGAAHSIDEFHTNVRRWRNGLGYHFVIGNGSATPAGLIEGGRRWAGQLRGAPSVSDEENQMNKTGIGICLVGNFENTHPTEAQMRALAVLVRTLQRRYNIPTRRVIGHRDVLPGHTLCPGENFSIERFRQML